MKNENTEDEITFPIASLCLVKDNDNNIIGVDVSEDGQCLDETQSESLKQFLIKRVSKLQENDDYLREILKLYENDNRDEISYIIRKKIPRIDQFFLYFLDCLEDQKSKAKAGGAAKNATLNLYKDRAKRYFSEKKISENGVYKQIVFAVDFVKLMEEDFNNAQESLVELNNRAAVLKSELEKLDFNQRNGSAQSEELRSIKSQIRLLARHPKPVTPDTVVTWLVGI